MNELCLNMTMYLENGFSWLVLDDVELSYAGREDIYRAVDIEPRTELVAQKENKSHTRSFLAVAASKLIFVLHIVSGLVKCVESCWQT